MREHLIGQIKEMLGSLVDEIVDIDHYLENKSEKELKAIIISTSTPPKFENFSQQNSNVHPPSFKKMSYEIDSNNGRM